MTDIELKNDRKNDSDKIRNSDYPRKVVVAGPGTGKSFLFRELIEDELKKGNSNFLAITFMGRLCDELSDDLAGLAKVVTLHGFARDLLLKQMTDEKWVYQKNIKEIILEDLKASGVTDCDIGDDQYYKRTKYYKAVGHDDVVFYTNKFLNKEKEKTPRYDLILVDEFQDFNEAEAQLIDLLAEKNRIVIVGDDDQALYGFKGSFSKFIRAKYDKNNPYFESHCLKYCSRCTDVIIKAFHRIVDFYKQQQKLINRIDDKQYICFYPDKKKDNDSNKKIVLIEDIPLGGVHKKIRSELDKLLKNQKIKSVLVLGEATSLKFPLNEIAQRLKELGFKNVNLSDNSDIFNFNNNVFDAYKIFYKNNNLSWRILLSTIKDNLGESYQEIIKKSFDENFEFKNSLSEEFIKEHESNARTFNNISTKTKYARDAIADSSILKLSEDLVDEKKKERELFVNQIIKKTRYLARPLANLEISVCSILKSKGLSADVVFLVGFDDGKLPKEAKVKNEEIYQLLVALTRAKKRIYLLNTVNSNVSQFSEAIGEDLIERIKYKTKKD